LHSERRPEAHSAGENLTGAFNRSPDFTFPADGSIDHFDPGFSPPIQD
jgi:hypothetical protein